MVGSGRVRVGSGWPAFLCVIFEFYWVFFEFRVKNFGPCPTRHLIGLGRVGWPMIRSRSSKHSCFFGSKSTKAQGNNVKLQLQVTSHQQRMESFSLFVLPPSLRTKREQRHLHLPDKYGKLTHKLCVNEEHHISSNILLISTEEKTV